MKEISTICHICRADHSKLECTSFVAECPICQRETLFEADTDYCSARDQLSSQDCPNGGCLTRERALASVLRSEYSDEELKTAKIHECSPANRGMAVWFSKNCPSYLQTGYFPNQRLGSIVEGLRNENLEKQTFDDAVFDLAVHLDVMEHLFNPFEALNEIYRTLVPGGKCVFSVPTYWDQLHSIQVAFELSASHIETFGDPEFHGNPQETNGSIVTWRYGYDLPLLISRKTKFNVEVRRFQSRRVSALGLMNEIYILEK